MSRKKKVVLSLFAVLALLVTALHWPTRVGRIVFYVKTGQAPAEVQRILAAQGFNRPQFLFNIAQKLFWLRFADPKGGMYEFSGSVSLWQLYRKISAGQVVKVLITEGMNQAEIAERIAPVFPNSSFIQKLKNREVDYEGYLFPETYAVDSPDPEQLVAKMRREFVLKTHHLKITKRDLILASIIQLEGQKNRELNLIAGVFLNRLKRRMKLQSCATIQFFTGKSRVTPEHLKTEHPYNTYLHRGLPPGPVGNPGLAAIKAALRPEKSDYLYFVSNGKDGHIFSRSFPEHRLAAYRYRQLRKNDRVWFGL